VPPTNNHHCCCCCKQQFTKLQILLPSLANCFGQTPDFDNMKTQCFFCRALVPIITTTTITKGACFCSWVMTSSMISSLLKVIAFIKVLVQSALARSEWFYARISTNYITGTDRHSVRAQTVLKPTTRGYAL
jgi:hypothetical protein